MIRFVRHKGSRAFVILAMLGMVMNAFAYAPSDCCCNKATETSEVDPTNSSCCNSSSAAKSCCSKSSSCCCSELTCETNSSLCECGEDCGCGTSELPEPLNSVPQIPSSPTQNSFKDFSTSSGFAFVSFCDENRPNTEKYLKVPPGIHCSALQTCALLSRFTC